MAVRQLKQSDWPMLLELFAKQGFTYELPKNFAVKHVVTNGNDVPVMAILARPTVELYMLLDAEWESPAMRMEALKHIHESVRRELETRGFEDANIWIPPVKEKSFGRRLMKSFGWKKNLWSCYTRRTKG